MISEIKELFRDKFTFIFPFIRAGVIVAKHQLSRRRIRRILTERSEIFIEVGAGDKKGENGWTTIDVTNNCDIYWDLRKGLPFPNESILKIYSEHFFEHLSFKECQKFLDDCLRVLVPDGTFSICVPNARIYIEAYLKDRTLDNNQFFGYKPAYNNTTKIDYVNYTAYMNGHHKYMFDEENIIVILRDIGFRQVRLRSFDPHLDQVDRQHESIYAEGVK